MSISTLATWRRAASGLTQSILAASVMCVLASAADARSTADPGRVATLAGATTLRDGELVSGFLPYATPLHIVVSLKLRNRDVLDKVVASMADPADGATQGKAMTTDEFVANHSPTADQAKSVAEFLTRAGFKNIDVAPNRLLISADGTADIVQAAFQTTISRVKATDGREAYANTDAVHIPAALQDSVLAVFGLQNVHHAHTIKQPESSAKAVTVTAHNPLEFPTIYGATGVPTAAGVTVGIIAQGDMSNVLSDLVRFASNNGLPQVVTQVVNTNGTSSDISSDGEWDLDSQTIVGMAGGRVGKLIFYVMPTFSNADLTANFNTVVNAKAPNMAKVINVSLGDCELAFKDDGSAAAQDQIFQQAIAQGQTFSASSGDTGSNECRYYPGNAPPNTPLWPSSSKNVVSVGGTRLIVVDGVWRSEVVWNDADGATGGSPSTFEPMPAWQQNVGQNAGHTTRGVPDIAFDAARTTGALIIHHGVTNAWGGTSLASPIFVGAWARILAAKGLNIGFAAPLIYKLPAADFHDVVNGNDGGETAAPGWDYTTGFGSMILSNVLRDIGGTPVAYFSYSTNGLSVSFTDLSSDANGVIGSHAWNFGDGATSTATNPSHAYAAAGTYSVTETVTDSVSGKSSTRTASVSVTSPISMTATPNPVVIPAGATSGNFTLTWNAPGYSSVTLYGIQNLSNPGKVVCLGSGPASGSAPESMQRGEVADLYLVAFTGCTPGAIVAVLPSPVLAHVQVTAPAPTMTATPNPVVIPAGATFGSFTLTWDAPGYSQVTLYGEQNLQNPGQIVCLGSGAGSGSAPQSVQRGEIAHLYLTAYSGCTPGSIVSTVPGSLVNLTVTAQ